MRRLGLAGLALLLALAAPASAGAPSRLQVTAREWSLTLSRQTLRAGPAVIELVNFGQDAHDLRLRRIGATHIAGTRLVQPRDIVRLSLTLAPGRYRLWCSLPGHARLGMTATLRVVRG
jgi:hypothetical protein